ncbi:sensor histidine kinase [Nonomuraea pusilla]|uniref:sensor histidine kinase n=1 Tax=Nonomuraea pusilla TaxID=46177 RepID=UPI0033202F94
MHPDRARTRGEPPVHVAAPYGSETAFLEATVPRVRAALSEGGRVLAVVRPERMGLLAGALGVAAERIEARSPASWYAHPHRMLAACHEYARAGPVLVVGEPPWERLDDRAARELVRYDGLLNAALRGAPASLLCLYDERTTPLQVLGLCPVVHPVVLGAAGERPSAGFVEPHELVLDGDLAPLPEPAADAHVVRFTARELKRVRQAVGDYARAAGMHRNLITSIVLSVSEIAANSVEHGAGHGTVTMWVERGGASGGGELVCEVANPGGGLDDPLPGYLPPEPESPRGYGLWISRQLCDLVELRDRDGVLRVRLHLGLGGPC